MKSKFTEYVTEKYPNLSPDAKRKRFTRARDKFLLERGKNETSVNGKRTKELIKNVDIVVPSNSDIS